MGHAYCCCFASPDTHIHTLPVAAPYPPAPGAVPGSAGQLQGQSLHFHLSAAQMAQLQQQVAPQVQEGRGGGGTQQPQPAAPV